MRIVTLALLLVARSAYADGRAELHAEADDAMERGRPSDARAALLALWEMDREPSVACSIGQLSSRMGDPLLAREYLTHCIDGGAGTDTDRAELGRALATLGSLRVIAPGSSVCRIDGLERDCDAVVWVIPGVHAVTVQRAGLTERRDAAVRARERSVLSFPQHAAPRVSPPRAVPSAGPAWVGLAAGFALGGLGAALFAASGAEYRAAERGARAASAANGCAWMAPGCDAVADDLASYRRLRASGTVAFIGAGLSLAFAGTHLIVRANLVTVAGTW
jgi:hypothetical protein